MIKEYNNCCKQSRKSVNIRLYIFIVCVSVHRYSEYKEKILVWKAVHLFWNMGATQDGTIYFKIMVLTHYPD